MRVFWFNNLLFPEAAQSLGLPPPDSGGWMPSLGHALNETGKIKLAVATVVKNPAWSTKEIDGIKHYAIPYPEGGSKEIILSPGEKLLGDCLRAIEDFAPDIVHIHGTEYFYGSLSSGKLIKCPTVVSLQGLIKECAKVYFGGLPLREVLKCQSVYDALRGRGLLFDKIIWQKRAKYMEDKIIKGNQNLIGRTLWAKTYTCAVNPSAHYYHCDVILRPPFYSVNWDRLKIRKHTIFAPAASYPLKGLHWLLKAVALLRKDFPDITLKVAGLNLAKKLRRKNYLTYLRGLIDSLALGDCVVGLGFLTAEQMAQELSKAHVFVIPSLVENSPNSLSEAMLVGTPSVASLVGGIPTLIDDGETALGFPAGDVERLAECLRRLFIDDKLADQLSKSAKTVAHKRHDKKLIVKTMIDIYEAVKRQGC